MLFRTGEESEGESKSNGTQAVEEVTEGKDAKEML